jgi:spermidine synthase
MMLRKFLSYFIPINIFKTKSQLSKSLEVTWANGELVLDSENTNYSYGSLQRILRKGLKTIGLRKIVEMNHILVLGVGGGSVIKTLTEEFRYKGKITGVEIDKEIIEIANSFFKLNEVQNLEIVIDDAFEFILKTKLKYDLIIIDIFQDTKMPNFLFEGFFLSRIDTLLNENGIILFNTMILNNQDETRNLNFISLMKGSSFNIKTIPRVEQHNEVIILEKRNKT